MNRIRQLRSKGFTPHPVRHNDWRTGGISPHGWKTEKSGAMGVSPRGFTFIEVLMAVFILSVGISAVLMLYTSSMLSAATAWDMTVATSNAEHILEEMQVRDSLADIVNTDWPQWAQDHGLNTLPKETFSVTFADPAGDPLNIQITVGWEKKLRTNQITLKTRLTK